MSEMNSAAIPRPLGALEKLFWLADQNRPTHFAIAAEVGGSTRIDQWQDALDRVCRQSVLIWSRILPDERGAPDFARYRMDRSRFMSSRTPRLSGLPRSPVSSISRSMRRERRCYAARCCMALTARSSYSACTTPSRMVSRSPF